MYSVDARQLLLITNRINAASSLCNKATPIFLFFFAGVLSTRLMILTVTENLYSIEPMLSFFFCFFFEKNIVFTVFEKQHQIQLLDLDQSCRG